MASNGELVAARALHYEGVREATGNNDGQPIERWQRASGVKYAADYTGAPWCAIFIDNVAREAGVSIDRFLTHPYTGYICQRADQMGGLEPSARWPVGTWMIYCRIHVGIVVRDRGDGLLDTIEGNVNNGVRRLVREKSRCRGIAWPGVGTATGSAWRASYGFDDYSIRPTTYGPWGTKAGRDRVMDDYGKAPKGQWGPVAVRLDRDGPEYAFRIGAPGHKYGDPWRFGGWASKDRRDTIMDEYARNNPTAKLRTWAKRVPASTGGASSNISTE